MKKSSIEPILFPPMTELQETGNGIDLGSSTIHLMGEVDGVIARKITSFLSLQSQTNLPVDVKISSTGGDLNSALSIIAAFKRHPNKIVGDITGVAFSAAALIALFCDTLYMNSMGLMMFHYPSWDSESLALNQYRTDVNAVEEHFERILKESVAGTGLKYAALKKQIEVSDYYLAPEKCLEYKLVDLVY